MNFLEQLEIGLKRQNSITKEDKIHGMYYPEWYHEINRMLDKRNHLMAGIFMKVRPTKLREPEYYSKLFKNINLSLFYVDCARYRTSFGGRTISSAYTEHGIRTIDKNFAEAIQAYGNGDTSFTFKQLYCMILMQPHLHECIKANLVANLKQIENDKEKN